MSSPLVQSVWLVPCYALIGSVIASLWSPRLISQTGPRPAGYISLVATLIGFFHSLFALVEVWGQPPIAISLPWFHAAQLSINVDLKLSSVTIAAVVLITALNLLAQFYAVAYLEMDWGWARFYSVVGLFEAGLCALVLCNSLFFSYFILEILTLSTYLLIGFWYNQSLVITGARDAFLTKRVGDLILLVGVVALLPLTGTWNFDQLREWASSGLASGGVQPATLTLICLALMAGPLAKSAQFPLHLWLDEAQEGPLPASVLRNAVVVVTGAWVLIKVQPIIALSPTATLVLLSIASATAIGAALIAIAQIDIKRILSYAVSSYMGLAFITIAVGQLDTAYLLLFLYAVAMALLMMSIGTIVLSNVTQNVTQLGGLWGRRPIPGLAFLVGTFALVAVPPFGTFWALAPLATYLQSTHPLLLGLLLTVNALTSFSLIRLFLLVWGGQPTPMTIRSPEVLWFMVLPVTILTGVILHIPQLLISLHLQPDLGKMISPAAIGLCVTGILGAVGAIAVYGNSNISKPVQFPYPAVQNFFAYDLYTAQFYRATIVAAVDIISRFIDFIDRYIVDGLVNLLGLATLLSGQGLKYNVSGQVQSYAFTIIIGIGTIVLLILWPILTAQS
ncbi:MAG: NAD(P)H-quinone oxidoreductase subunit F [Prochlorotrichaceae cyanobacterium]|jgi:NAD(P)H-quinone oxidoreductase subunit 5